MINYIEQRVISIRVDTVSGKAYVTTNLIPIPMIHPKVCSASPQENTQQMLPLSTSDGLLLNWDHQQREHGIILSARIAGTALNYESALSAWVRIRLNDQQIRDLAVDLVRAAMMRGIEFKGPRKWWQIWARKRVGASD